VRKGEFCGTDGQANRRDERREKERERGRGREREEDSGENRLPRGAKLRGAFVDHRGYVLNNLAELSVSQADAATREKERACQGDRVYVQSRGNSDQQLRTRLFGTAVNED